MENNIDFEMFNRERPAHHEQPPKKKTAVKKFAAGKAVLAVIFIAVLLFGAAELYAVFSVHNPEKLLTHYLNAILDRDWQKAYGDLCFENQITKNCFVTQEAFVDYCSKNPDAMNPAPSNIVDFEIEEDKADDTLRSYCVKYLSDDKSIGTLYFDVLQTKDGFLNFDRYKVIPPSEKIPSFTAYGIYGTSVKLNGIELTSTDIAAADSSTGRTFNLGKYTAEYILPGEYELSASNVNFDQISTSVTVASGERNELYLEQKLTESAYTELCDTAADALKKIYTGVMQDNFDSSSLQFTENFKENGLNSIIRSVSEELYKSNTNYNITQLEFTSVKPEKEQVDIVFNGQNEIRIDIPLDFDYKYTAVSPDYLGSEYSEQKSDKGKAYFSFTLDDAVWKIDNISSRAWF